MSGRNFIPYTEFDPTRLIGEKPVSKDLPKDINGQSQGQYHEIELKYNTGTAEKPQYKNVHIEGPEMETGGIATRTQNGKTSYSIFVKFPLDNPELQDFVQKTSAGYTRCAEILNAVKGAVKLVHFSLASPEALFPHFIYRPRDELTGEIDHSKAPSQWIKLQNYVYEGKTHRTIFAIPPTESNPKPDPLDWSLLQNVTMKIIPIISWKKIYVGQKAYIQIKMSSAIVTDIKPMQTGSRQAETMNRLVQADPSLGNRLADQIAKLTMQRHDAAAVVNGNDFVNPVAYPSSSSSTQTDGFSGGSSNGSTNGQQSPQQYQSSPQQYQSSPQNQQYQSPPQQYQPQPPSAATSMQVLPQLQTVQQTPQTVPQLQTVPQMQVVPQTPQIQSGAQTPPMQSTPQIQTVPQTPQLQMQTAPQTVPQTTPQIQMQTAPQSLPGAFSQFISPSFQVLSTPPINS